MKPNIRSITLFEQNNSSHSFFDNIRSNNQDFEKKVKSIFKDVRTLRWTLPAIHLATSDDLEQSLIISNKKSETLSANGFRWVNQPLVCDNIDKNPLEKISEKSISSLINSRDVLFSSLVVNKYDDIDLSSDLYSKISKSIARSDVTGFSNFRFGIGFEISSGTPFFPFSFSNDEGFSVAVESFTFINNAWDEHKSLSFVADKLTEALLELDSTCLMLSSELDIPFLGMDWSLAPLPNSDQSVCSFIEKINNAPIGSPGTLSTIEKVTAALKAPVNKVNSTGFNGVMLSVLEDDVLAARFSSGHIDINDLMLLSSVCGCGLDMIPISDDVSNSSLSSVVKDVGSMAFRLKKPLGVRLLTMHEKKPGEETNFSHDFVTNSKVTAL